MKVVLDPFKILNSQALVSTFNSQSFESIAYYGMALQVVISGAAALNGSMKLQMSNDGASWTDVPTDAVNAANPQTLTANGSYFWVYKDIVPYKFMRVAWTSTGGAGTANAFLTGVRV